MNRMRRSRYLVPILAIALCPSTAFANAGTPLMWASMLHLALGNALIGVIEGLLLAHIFKCSKLKAISSLIVANYASAWAGGFYMTGYLASLPDITIENLRGWFLIFMSIAFVITLLIEFPFFWLALRPRKQVFRKSWMATLAIHGISYPLLLGWYWLASGTSMMTRLEVVPASEMRLPNSYWVYYLSLDGEELIRIRLGDLGSKEVILKTAAHDNDSRLFARPRNDSRFDLMVIPGLYKEREETKLLESFSQQAPVDDFIVKYPSEIVRGTWFNLGPVPSLAEKSEWEFHTGFWPSDGIRGTHLKNNQTIRFSLEIPFVAWATRNATHLPGDYIVFQLGSDQICILHPENRKIALIARGKGPLVAK